MSDPSARAILQALPAGLVVVDRDGCIAAMNPAGAAILRVEAAATVGRSVDRLLAPLSFLIDGQRADGQLRPELVVMRPDGSSVTVGYSIGEMEDGQWAVLFQDISGYARVRRERDRLLQIATVSDVVPSMLHELRNPLAAITSTVELLLEEELPDELQAELQAVLSEVRRMDLGFQGLGVVGRSLGSERRAIIDRTIQEVSRVLRSGAARAGVILRVDVTPMPRLPLDPMVVRAILFNLVNNAIAACREGDEIRIRARVVDGRFELVVADTGAGMSSDILHRCTELFFTTKSRGSGIGLALCRRAVESADGVLSVYSTEGRGTQVRIDVPVESSADAQVGSAS